jgi:chromate transporter
VSTAVTAAATDGRASLGQLVRYFLYLGTLGFGGPVALVGFIQRDVF